MDITLQIKEDFEYEMSIAQFPFSNFIRDNDYYKSLLIFEFCNLEPEPKLNLYFKEFISDDVWSKNCVENKGPVYKSSDRTIVAANFIADTEIDKLASRVISDFDTLKRKGEVSLKYYGRFITKTETVILLEQIRSEIDLLMKYVLHNKNVSDYLDFSKTSAKKILKLINNISNKDLRVDLANYFLNVSDDDIRVNIYFMNVKYLERTDIFEKFKILKSFADEIIADEFPSSNNYGTKLSLIKPYIKPSLEINLLDFQSQFKNPLQYNEVIKKLIKNDRVFEMENDSKLGFSPFRKNARNEAVTVFEAAKELGMLKKTYYTSQEVRNILSNTFINWKLSTRVIGDPKTRKKLDDYMTIIR